MIRIVMTLSIVLSLIIVSCSNRTDYSFTNNVLINKTVVLPFDSMISLSYNKKKSTETVLSDYKLIVFGDSTRCSPCQINSLIQWESFDIEAKKLCGNYNTLFIFSPAKSFMSFMHKSLKGNQLRNQMYLDTSYIFKRMNTFIPDDNWFHSLLVDNNNNIILVGNPIENESVKELVFKKITE